MICEVKLSREQERKFFELYHELNLDCTNEEYVQTLFNQALDTAYLRYKHASEEDKLEDAKNRRR